MNGVFVGLIVLFCLTGASFAMLVLHPRLSPAKLEERTHDAVKLAIGMIVVMTSLVLSLLTASVKTSFDQTDQNLHQFSTSLILLDRTLRHYGPEAETARALLRSYTEEALVGTWPRVGRPIVKDPVAADVLDDLETAIRALKPVSDDQRDRVSALLTRFHQVLELRWRIIEQHGSSISSPLLIILIGWLTLIFASFGYNAPFNWIVVTTLLLCTISISAVLFLIVEMDDAFGGFIKVSDAPIVMALDYMRH